MAKSVKVFVTDKNKFMELDLIPDDTNNTWNSIDEIKQWNNGSQEDAGFHWNDDEGRWETDYDNFEWWDELGKAREKAYKKLDYDDDLYIDLIRWANEQGYIDSNDLETEKYLPEYVKEFLKNYDEWLNNL